MTDSERQLGMKRELAKLAVARSDVQAALELCEFTLTSRPVPNSPLFWAVHNAVVVTYARPFTSSRGHGMLLGAKWARFENRQLRVEHAEVMKHRDTIVAHSDREHRPVFIAPHNAQLPDNAVLKNAEMPADRIHPQMMVMVERPGLNIESYTTVRALCLDLLPRLTTRINELFAALWPQGYDGPQAELLPRKAT